MSLPADLPWIALAVAGALAGPAVAWAALRPAREPSARRTPAPDPLSSDDIASVAARALALDRYDALLAASRARLAAWSLEHLGAELDRLPGRWAHWRGRTTPDGWATRRLARRLDREHASARRAERPGWPRVDLWRSEAAARRARRRAVARLLADLEARVFGRPPDR